MIASPCRDVLRKKPGMSRCVDRLDQQADAGLLQSLGGERQVLDEDVLQRGAIHALRRDAGKAIDLAAAERLGIGDRRVDAAAELVDAVGQHARCRARRLPQSPAGRLNSTCVSPFFLSRAATTSGG